MIYWTKIVSQRQLAIYWAPGPDNRGDIHTKYHPAKHFRESANRHTVIDSVGECVGTGLVTHPVPSADTALRPCSTQVEWRRLTLTLSHQQGLHTDLIIFYNIFS
jgi:hypothetical protein